MPGETDPIEDLKKLVNDCADAEGYLVFTARLIPGKGLGEKQLEFNYRRYHLTLDDAALAVRNLKKEVLTEIKGEIDASN